VVCHLPHRATAIQGVDGPLVTAVCVPAPLPPALPPCRSPLCSAGESPQRANDRLATTDCLCPGFIRSRVRPLSMTRICHGAPSTFAANSYRDLGHFYRHSGYILINQVTRRRLKRLKTGDYDLGHLDNRFAPRIATRRHHHREKPSDARPLPFPRFRPIRRASRGCQPPPRAVLSRSRAFSCESGHVQPTGKAHVD